MIVLGLDSSMTHTGYYLMEVDTGGWDRRFKGNIHGLCKKIESGTFKFVDTSIPLCRRLIEGKERVIELINDRRPDLVCLEGALTVGASRSVTGLTLYTMIVEPWFPVSYRRLSLSIYNPRWFVIISPERLNSLAFNKQKTTGKETKEFYRDLTGDQAGFHTYSVHEADAYFVGYFGVRFVVTTLLKQYPENLTSKEKRIFQTSVGSKRGQEQANSILSKQGEGWWEIPRVEE